MGSFAAFGAKEIVGTPSNKAVTALRSVILITGNRSSTGPATRLRNPMSPVRIRHPPPEPNTLEGRLIRDECRIRGERVGCLTASP
jgi:hypothetical protein